MVGCKRGTMGGMTDRVSCGSDGWSSAVRRARRVLVHHMRLFFSPSPSFPIFTTSLFAYSESKLTCHFVLVVLLLVVVLVLGGKRSEKVRKRSKKVTSS